MKNDNLKNQYRVNEQIRAREVRIVGDDIESVVMPLQKAWPYDTLFLLEKQVFFRNGQKENIFPEEQT